jgi:anti-anti-sigma factor
MTVQPHNMSAIFDQRKFDATAHPSRIRVVVRVRRSIVALSVYGEVDAFNAAYVGEVLGRFACLRRRLVVDLGALRFCGLAGVRMLEELNADYRAGHVRWALVVGPAVAEVLRLTAVAGTLPTAMSVDDALQLVEPLPPARRRRRRLAGA